MSPGPAPHPFDESALNVRSFADRAADLSRPQRIVYRRILQRLIDGTERPLAGLTAAQTASLVEADLLQSEDGDRLNVAYPFAIAPTRHRVTLQSGRGYYAMCAIDALGIPYMLGERGEVEAREPEAERIVRVMVDPGGEPAWEPEQAVVLAASGEGACLAEAACPHINLFVSVAAARGYLDAHRLRGRVLSIPEATTAARWVFGDLLEILGDGEAR
jgi:hypothetical protein